MARDLAKLWRTYAETGPGGDAPLYRGIANAVAADEALLEIVRASPPDTHHPNHLLAAVRFLLLGGVVHPLAECYRTLDGDGAIQQFRSFALEHRDTILDVLATRRVQTNEVGRSALILAGLDHISRRVQTPLGLVDVGASAGLNLLVDEYRIHYGPFAAGPASSRVRLSCELRGPQPWTGPGVFNIDWRVGLDRDPVDLDDEASARWLLACVWPEQQERIDRLASAIELQRERRSRVVTGDAVCDLLAILNSAPDHVHLVVLTSWVAFYLTADERVEFEQVMTGTARPITWLSLEHLGVVPDIAVTSADAPDSVAPSAIACVSYGPGASREFLGWAHPHGRWLDWRAEHLCGATPEYRWR